MIKEILKNYLDDYFDDWIKNRGSYPMVSYDEDNISDLYFGEPDEDEDIQWKYTINNKKINFSILEEKYKVEIPQEVKEYYTSYLFLQLEGFFNGVLIWLEPITDFSDIIGELEFSFENEYKDKIQIGVYGKEDLPIYVEIKTGQIIVFDEERNFTWKIANTLSDFLKQLSPRKC